MPQLDIIYQNEDEDLRSYRVDFSKIEKSLNFRLQKPLDKAIEELFYLCSNELISDYESIKYRNH